MKQLSDTEKLNQFAKILDFEKTWDFTRFLRLPHRLIASFTGNQRGKTAHYAMSYIYRIMSWHPIPMKNVLYFECPKYEEHGWKGIVLEDGSKLKLHRAGQYNFRTLPKDAKCQVCGEKVQIHERESTIFRFCSETLPGQKETVSDDGMGQSTEVKNAAYPEFKKWLPPWMIKKDITARNTTMTIFNPYKNHEWGHIHYDGPDIVVEFVSYSQTVQAGAGVQRLSVWADEEPPMPFYEEQMPRLLAEEGDFLLSLTPANKMSWTFDEVFERASLYVRTPAICEFLSKDSHEEVQQIEYTDSERDIAVIQAATDDNPTLKKEAIEQLFMWDDADTIATRRYGVHRQSSGRVFPGMDFRYHIISEKKYFSDGIPQEDWVHARSIDFHDRNPWAVVWLVMSPWNEAFVYREWNPSPLKWVNTTIGEQIADMSGMTRFSMDLIDPLANKVQTNTGITTVEDLNNVFMVLKKEGTCRGANWEPFDTKGHKGRDEIRKRLANSIKVGKPFNNEVLHDGKRIRVPTLWILDCCREVARSLKQWRYEDWSEARDMVNKERKDTPVQKFSHFCTAMEGVFKDIRFRPRVSLKGQPGGARRYGYFQNG